MKIESFNANADFKDERIVTKVLLETSFSKEIRILLKEGQTMKEHKAPYPIVVHVLEGAIEFGCEGSVHQLKLGDVVSLAAGVPHDLSAKSDSIVRLTLSKLDKAERVENVVVDS